MTCNREVSGDSWPSLGVSGGAANPDVSFDSYIYVEDGERSPEGVMFFSRDFRLDWRSVRVVWRMPWVRERIDWYSLIQVGSVVMRCWISDMRVGDNSWRKYWVRMDDMLDSSVIF